MTETPKPQLDKFEDLARELEADEDEERFEETVKRVAKPRLAKAMSQAKADELRELGWTLKHEFRADGDDQLYEYVFEWTLPGEPRRPPTIKDEPKVG